MLTMVLPIIHVLSRYEQRRCDVIAMAAPPVTSSDSLPSTYSALMKVLSFDSGAGRHIDLFGSDFLQVPLARCDGEVFVSVMYLAPGGSIGRHRATTPQLFCVVEGEGVVSGGDGIELPVTRGQAALWDEGELHETKTDHGLTAVTVEGAALESLLSEAP